MPVRWLIPVMFPPGRGMLWINPSSTGLPANVTIGTVCVTASSAHVSANVCTIGGSRRRATLIDGNSNYRLKINNFLRRLSTVAGKGRRYQIRSLLCDHDGRGVDVRRRDRRHDRGVNHAQALNPSNA